MAATPFRLTISVAAGDIDEQRHVNNTVYLRWVQEAALAHWQVIASPESQQSIDWVVLRPEIDYKAPAVAGETLDVSTWVGKATRGARLTPKLGGRGGFPMRFARNSPFEGDNLLVKKNSSIRIHPRVRPSHLLGKEII